MSTMTHNPDSVQADVPDPAAGQPDPLTSGTRGLQSPYVGTAESLPPGQQSPYMNQSQGTRANELDRARSLRSLERAGSSHARPGDDEPVQVVRRGFPFAMIAIAIMYDCRLSRDARALYGVLAGHAGSSDRESWPSRRRLAEIMGRPGQPASTKSITRWTHELQAAGYLSIEERRRPDGTRTANCYVLLDHELIHPDAERRAATVAAREVRKGEEPF